MPQILRMLFLHRARDDSFRVSQCAGAKRIASVEYIDLGDMSGVGLEKRRRVVVRASTRQCSDSATIN
jgi:hypothetical protein